MLNLAAVCMSRRRLILVINMDFRERQNAQPCAGLFAAATIRTTLVTIVTAGVELRCMRNIFSIAQTAYGISSRTLAKGLPLNILWIVLIIMEITSLVTFDGQPVRSSKGILV